MGSSQSQPTPSRGEETQQASESSPIDTPPPSPSVSQRLNPRSTMARYMAERQLEAYSSSPGSSSPISQPRTRRQTRRKSRKFVRPASKRATAPKPRSPTEKYRAQAGTVYGKKLPRVSGGGVPSFETTYYPAASRFLKPTGLPFFGQPHLPALPPFWEKAHEEQHRRRQQEKASLQQEEARRQQEEASLQQEEASLQQKEVRQAALRFPKDWASRIERDDPLSARSPSPEILLDRVVKRKASVSSDAQEKRRQDARARLHEYLRGRATPASASALETVPGHAQSFPASVSPARRSVSPALQPSAPLQGSSSATVTPKGKQPQKAKTPSVVSSTPTMRGDGTTMEDVLRALESRRARAVAGPLNDPVAIGRALASAYGATVRLRPVEVADDVGDKDEEYSEDDLPINGVNHDADLPELPDGMDVDSEEYSDDEDDLPPNQDASGAGPPSSSDASSSHDSEDPSESDSSSSEVDANEDEDDFDDGLPMDGVIHDVDLPELPNVDSNEDELSADDESPYQNASGAALPSDSENSSDPESEALSSDEDDMDYKQDSNVHSSPPSSSEDDPSELPSRGEDFDDNGNGDDDNNANGGDEGGASPPDSPYRRGEVRGPRSRNSRSDNPSPSSSRPARSAAADSGRARSSSSGLERSHSDAISPVASEELSSPGSSPLRRTFAWVQRVVGLQGRPQTPPPQDPPSSDQDQESDQDQAPAAARPQQQQQQPTAAPAPPARRGRGRPPGSRNRRRRRAAAPLPPSLSNSNSSGSWSKISRRSPAPTRTRFRPSRSDESNSHDSDDTMMRSLRRARTLRQGALYNNHGMTTRAQVGARREDQPPRVFGDNWESLRKDYTEEMGYLGMRRGRGG